MGRRPRVDGLLEGGIRHDAAFEATLVARAVYSSGSNSTVFFR